MSVGLLKDAHCVTLDRKIRLVFLALIPMQPLLLHRLNE